MKKIIFWLLFMSFLQWSWSFACTRVPLSQETVREVYDYVVAGTVTKIEEVEVKKSPQGEDRPYFWRSDIHQFYYTFSIEQSFKGDISTGEIIIDKKIDYLGCEGWRLDVWGKYILYVDPIKDSHYYQSSSQQIVYLDDTNTLSTINKYDLWAPSRWQQFFHRIQSRRS